MGKSPEAFRTISEVAEWLGVQAHVLRFWESKFSQVKPVKRAGGRRYYRPNDMLLIGGIKKLLYEDGFTIKGVQKILREEGMHHVAQMSQPLSDVTLSEMRDDAVSAPSPGEAVETESGAPFQQAAAPVETASLGKDEAQVSETEDEIEPASTPASEAMNQPPTAAPQDIDTPAEPEKVAETTATALSPSLGPMKPTVVPKMTLPGGDIAMPDPSLLSDLENDVPDFLRTTSDRAPPRKPAVSNAASPRDQLASETTPTKASRPRIIDVAPFKPEETFPTTPGLISALTRAKALPMSNVDQIAPLLTQLTAMRDRLIEPAG
ncbi:MAG: MerR family transcriptional regulator [Pseudomonadota bacterium]